MAAERRREEEGPSLSEEFGECTGCWARGGGRGVEAGAEGSYAGRMGAPCVVPPPQRPAAALHGAVHAMQQCHQPCRPGSHSCPLHPAPPCPPPGPRSRGGQGRGAGAQALPGQPVPEPGARVPRRSATVCGGLQAGAPAGAVGRAGPACAGCQGGRTQGQAGHGVARLLAAKRMRIACAGRLRTSLACCCHVVWHIFTLCFSERPRSSSVCRASSRRCGRRCRLRWLHRWRTQRPPAHLRRHRRQRLQGQKRHPHQHQHQGPCLLLRQWQQQGSSWHKRRQWQRQSSSRLSQRPASGPMQHCKPRRQQEKSRQQRRQQRRQQERHHRCHLRWAWRSWIARLRQHQQPEQQGRTSHKPCVQQSSSRPWRLLIWMPR